MSLAILGIGTALPITAVSRDESIKVAQRLTDRKAEQADLLPALYRQSGIMNRHLAFPPGVVDDVIEGTRHTGSIFLPSEQFTDPGPTTAQRMAHYRREAGPLAIQASRKGLAASGLAAKAMTHLITVSCTGFGAPGVDVELINELGLPATIERTNVGFMGCHGALNGLRVGQAFVDSRPDARIMICAVELCGAHYHYPWDPKKAVANALFADGAAAAVGISASENRSNCWNLVASGSCVFPGSEHAMTWNIGDHGFEMTLSTKVPDLIARNLRPWITDWLAKNNAKIEDVGSWAIHPGGPRILRAVEETLGLERDRTTASWEVLESCGNMSSPTVLFIMDRLLKRDAPRPCVALGFGPGLTAEAALFH